VATNLLQWQNMSSSIWPEGHFTRAPNS
jgi:hypothetical protein